MQRLVRLYRERRLVRFGVEGALLVVAVAAIGAWQTRNHPRGTPPPVALRTLEGAPASLAAWRGRTTLVEVWAPWCGVCKVQTDNLARAHRWLGGRANVISVAASFESEAEVRAAMRAHDITVPVLLADARFTQQMRVSAYPTVFVLDADGRVVSSLQGYTTTLGLVLRALWAR